MPVLAGLSLSARAPRSTDRLREAPSRLLWAWERPEDLSFLDPAKGVAFWAGTVRLRGERVEVVPRRQELATRRSAWRMAVVRLESDARDRPVLGAPLRRGAATAILSLLGGDERALQIDFDALGSERGFYRGLLFDLRAGMPERLPLSITALASWCVGDPWLSGLPIDEAVPMLFRMGRDGPAVRRFLARGGDFRAPECRRSYGVSTDEPQPLLHTDRRVYLFHPGAWDAASASSALSAVERRGATE